MLLETIKKNAIAIEQAGSDAIARAKRLGVAVYYKDEAITPGYVKEYPDGRREQVDLSEGREVLLRQLMSAA